MVLTLSSRSKSIKSTIISTTRGVAIMTTTSTLALKLFRWICVVLIIVLSNYSSVLVVEGRCMESPSVETLYDTQSYAVRVNKTKVMQNDICDSISSELASPMIVKVVEVFKNDNDNDNENDNGSNMGDMPLVGDEFVMLYITDTGYDTWWVGIEENEFVVFPAKVSHYACRRVVIDNIERQVLQIDSCHWNGNQPWSNIGLTDRNYLRSADAAVSSEEKSSDSESSIIQQQQQDVFSSKIAISSSQRDEQNFQMKDRTQQDIEEEQKNNQILLGGNCPTIDVKYLNISAIECQVVRFDCLRYIDEGLTIFFNNNCGCGCWKPPQDELDDRNLPDTDNSSNNNNFFMGGEGNCPTDSDVNYKSKNIEICSLVKLFCSKNIYFTDPFNNYCGCGCWKNPANQQQSGGVRGDTNNVSDAESNNVALNNNINNNRCTKTLNSLPLSSLYDSNPYALRITVLDTLYTCTSSVVTENGIFASQQLRPPESRLRRKPTTIGPSPDAYITGYYLVKVLEVFKQPLPSVENKQDGNHRKFQVGDKFALFYRTVAGDYKTSWINENTDCNDDDKNEKSARDKIKIEEGAIIFPTPMTVPSRKSGYKYCSVGSSNSDDDEEYNILSDFYIDECDHGSGKKLLTWLSLSNGDASYLKQQQQNELEQENLSSNPVYNHAIIEALNWICQMITLGGQETTPMSATSANTQSSSTWCSLKNNYGT